MNFEQKQLLPGSLKGIFIGDLNTHTESKSKRDAFIRVGCQITSLSSEKIPYLPGLDGTSSLIERAKRKFTPMADPTQINDHLKKWVRSGFIGKFDFFWSDKAINLRPATLLSIKSNFPKIKLIFASGDNMAVSSFRNRAFEQSLGIFDAVITTKSKTFGDLKELGAKNVFYIPKAFDESWLNRLKRPERCLDISFIGSFEEDRANSILYLAKSGLEVNIWGNGWRKWSYRNKHPNLLVHGYPVYSDDFIEIIEKTKINLCFLRKLAKDESTNRTFEIPACGGFMLAENTDEQKAFFQENREASFFSDDEELARKCKYFLKYQKCREKIANKGHLKCRTSGYGYSDRCEQFFSEVWPKIP